MLNYLVTITSATNDFTSHSYFEHRSMAVIFYEAAKSYSPGSTVAFCQLAQEWEVLKDR